MSNSRNSLMLVISLNNLLLVSCFSVANIMTKAINFQHVNAIPLHYAALFEINFAANSRMKLITNPITMFKDGNGIAEQRKQIPNVIYPHFIPDLPSISAHFTIMTIAEIKIIRLNMSSSFSF